MHYVVHIIFLSFTGQWKKAILSQEFSILFIHFFFMHIFSSDKSVHWPTFILKWKEINPAVYVSRPMWTVKQLTFPLILPYFLLKLHYSFYKFQETRHSGTCKWCWLGVDGKVKWNLLSGPSTGHLAYFFHSTHPSVQSRCLPVTWKLSFNYCPCGKKCNPEKYYLFILSAS